ncbi:NADH-quinone oxidoreductase subunit M [Flexivirga endophytica]|uniref:NADH-quinone oxidoreductase subunit M n=1 Tax=Flexivirga endophytica TaxID=1849103 RepID=A0A916WTJ7_9MICO|nr:NADH-quinone oxidoreductase subunit M [Flexivirga endophytica]GGB28560.1 NADH-quinone oxidoreductase subunit M [Flexivirga endophytica]GHB62247.1 NADH-quinone oxidoreductase subunit M [Flexivirga endophytica]
MSDFPWLTTLGVIPLVGAAVVALLPKGATRNVRPIALAFSLLTLVVGIVAATQFKTSGDNPQFQLAETHSWIPQFGVSYAVGVDGMALSLILMSLVLVPISLLAAWNDIPEGGRRQQSYFALLLVLETFMVGVFAATDVFLFYVFFEAMLIPVYFLIGMFGGPRRQYAAVKFLLFSLFGGLIMLVAVIALYQQGPGGDHGFLVNSLTGLHMSESTERLLFVGFFIAFAIKAPMWPVHTWLPDAASEAKPAVAVLLVGVLDKVGTFGMIRFCLQLFPDASKWATPVVIILAVISIIYAAIAAIGQNDMMRLIAYTSVSHFGLIVLGIFAVTQTSVIGSQLYMVNHGITTAALFLFAGFLIMRGKSKNITDYGGWQRTTPVLAGVSLVAGLSALSLPGLNSFISEFLVLIGTFERYPVAAGISVVAVVLAALYILLMYKNIFTGPKQQLVAAPDGTLAMAGVNGQGGRPSTGVTKTLFDEPDTDIADIPAEAKVRGSAIRDLDVREKTVAGVLIAIMLFLGFFPKPALDLLKPAVRDTLQHVNVHDPAPHAGVTTEGSSK